VLAGEVVLISGPGEATDSLELEADSVELEADSVDVVLGRKEAVQGCSILFT
jgi:hypothetical protein